MTGSMSMEQRTFSVPDRLPLPSCGFVVAVLSAVLWALALQLL
jgi:hypothetical protein